MFKIGDWLVIAKYTFGVFVGWSWFLDPESRGFVFALALLARAGCMPLTQGSGSNRRSHGIGLELVERLQYRGWKVVSLGRDAKQYPKIRWPVSDKSRVLAESLSIDDPVANR